MAGTAFALAARLLREKTKLRLSIACTLMLVAVCAGAGEAGAGEGGAGPPGPDLYDRITDTARRLAAEPYREEPATPLPEALAALDYSAYRDIRFRKARALWAGDTDFSVEFFHPGFLYERPVTINEVTGRAVRPVAFDPAMFDYGQSGRLGELPPNLGFAGFRLHYPLHHADYDDEVIAFLGAAYFRMVGRGQRYGISARGLAVDTALPSGEEFPQFVEFWLVKPSPGSNGMTFYALLDSPSVTGAYAFRLESRAQTLLDVRVRLFARNDVGRLGIAPLTSMFTWGESGTRRFDDHRPEVHDSDGLLQHTGVGEWIWRPLVNPPELQVSTLLDPGPRGFGLAQRDRDFDSYQDPEARYDLRPGLWVTPTGGDWGSGAVQLVEIPSPDETHDNIVAYWLDDRPLEAGQTRELAYRLRTFGTMVNPAGLARVTGTRTGWGRTPGSADEPPPSVRQFAVDFEGGDLTGLAADQPVAAEMAVNRGQARNVTVEKLPGNDRWRLAFKLHPAAPAGEPVNMRAFLTLRGQRISETWNYLWHPKSVRPGP